MGIDINTSRFLISAYEDGVKFGKTLTMGRQNLYATESEVEALKSELQQINANKEYELSPRGFTEPMFEAFNTTELLSMDKSDFEGADFLHDMNFPIPEDYKEQFDLIYDGGTLEHIFNFPVAIKNEMEMVKVGGHLVLQTPTNNWSGHGFYQFSPELYFRVLSEANGYRIKRMVIFEWGPNKWYEVTDPMDVESRVYVVNACRASLLILAERIAAVEVNQTPPQQSDYEFLKWKAAEQAKKTAASAHANADAKTHTKKEQPKREPISVTQRIKSMVPERVKQTIKTAIGYEREEPDYFSGRPDIFKAVDR